MPLYEERLQNILNQAYPELEKQYELEFKKSFGAVAGYVNDNIFCSCGKFGFALKLPYGDIEELLKTGAEPLKYFPNGHVKKNYSVLPVVIMRNKNKLKELIITSTDYVTSQL